MNIIDVTTLGIKTNSEEIQTAIFQDIVNQYSNKDIILYFPKGSYVLSTVFLKDHTHIELDKDAIIYGAPSFYDYAKEEEINYPLYQDSSHSYFDCSLFVGKNITDIAIFGSGTIDMNSVWDIDNVRNIVHRGPKCIALKECNDVYIKDISVYNATDLAIYFAGCKHVDIDAVKLKVYIDGISPDCSSDVSIRNCYVESGDDGIVFKSSYTLNRLEYCKNIKVSDCVVKSRCNAIKFGTESNGGFFDIDIKNIKIFNSRITGISLETVDGALIDNISFSNITMKNVGTPIFVHIGNRLRGPEGTDIGSISNVKFDHITATGPYKLYECMPWNYDTFIAKDCLQFPGVYSKDKVEPTGSWQIASNVCGYPGHNIKNISFSNIKFVLDGGVKEYSKEVSEMPKEYPEVNTYGRILPASGIYFRHINGLTLKKVKIKLLHKDSRDTFIFDDVSIKGE